MIIFFSLNFNLLITEIRLTLILLTVNAHILVKALICRCTDVASAVARSGQVVDASRFASSVALSSERYFLIKTINVMESAAMLTYVVKSWHGFAVE